MSLSSGTRSLLGELASWTAAAAIVVAGIVYYDTLRTGLSSALGVAEPSAGTVHQTAAEQDLSSPVPGKSGVQEIKSGPDGHYYARAEVNGRPIDVMVDTGASMVALTYEDALRAGLSLRPSDFTGRVSTANGVAAVAPVTLARVTIGRITVRDIRAAVCERGKLERTLLGMSFLSRLERVDINQGRLTLYE
jgi:aspartyl protease family protein